MDEDVRMLPDFIFKVREEIVGSNQAFDNNIASKPRKKRAKFPHKQSRNLIT
jgi:hypothetical protein